MIKKICTLLMLICSLNKAVAQKDTTADLQYIRNARTASNEAIARKDIIGVSKFWADDYVEISSDGSLISGKEAVMADWKKMFENNPSMLFERQFGKIEFTYGDKVAIEKGLLIYTLPYKYKGYYTALWRKIDGVWVTQMENFVSLW